MFVTLSQQILRDNLLQVFNLNLPLKLFDYLSVTTPVHNNPTLKICCKNIVDIYIAFLIG